MNLFIELYLDEDVSTLVADLLRARGFSAPPLDMGKVSPVLRPVRGEMFIAVKLRNLIKLR